VVCPKSVSVKPVRGDHDAKTGQSATGKTNVKEDGKKKVRINGKKHLPDVISS
jgi:hypothetical protein